MVVVFMTPNEFKQELQDLYNRFYGSNSSSSKEISKVKIGIYSNKIKKSIYDNN
jgi:hypothetical protein